MAFSLGLTAELTKVSMTTIKSMDEEFINGKTAESTTVSGLMVSKMA